MSGLFGTLEAANPNRGGVYFEPGVYLVEVAKVLVQRSSKSPKTFFIVEAKILESNNPEREPGMTCSQVIDLTKEAAMGNVKGFLAAVLGVRVESPTLNADLRAAWQAMTGEALSVEQIAEAVVGPDNILKETELRLECAHVKMRNGGIFTKHTWSSVE